MDDRSYRRTAHPPYCTCVQCARQAAEAQQRTGLMAFGPVRAVLDLIARLFGRK